LCADREPTKISCFGVIQLSLEAGTEVGALRAMLLFNGDYSLLACIYSVFYYLSQIAVVYLVDSNSVRIDVLGIFGFILHVELPILPNQLVGFRRRQLRFFVLGSVVVVVIVVKEEVASRL
jgi:hypothetical protein